MHVRRCWPVLLLKANHVLEHAAGELARARQKVMTLSQQRERVTSMLDEYVDRHRALTQGDHYVSESLAMQRFLAQLRQMLDKIDAEVFKAENACRAAAEALNAAQAQVSKFGKLIELEDAALHDSAGRSEARFLDEMGLMRFRFRDP